jgi:peroxisome-assembly ATPase
MLARLPRAGGQTVLCLARGLATGPVQWYQSRVQSGKLLEDPHQAEAAKLLQRVHDELVVLYQQVGHQPASPAPAGAPSVLSRLFDQGSERSPGRPSAALGREGPRGMYMWGGVGCGKSMLMDSFFDTCPMPEGRKRRVHFHSFMLEVHRRIHRHRQEKREGDAVLSVASEIAHEAQLLCFDEFQVTDVGDAMLMHRLFGRMFDRGITMVATSNRPPDDLYKHGLQRELFEPCIDRVKRRCEVFHLGSHVDYRTAGEQAGKTWIAQEERSMFDELPSIDADTVDAAFEETWRHISHGQQGEPMELEQPGRKIPAPRAVTLPDGSKACMYSFEELCEEARGATDYLLIASTFSTVFVKGVPHMTLTERNEVRRFITLVDVLYEAKCRLYVSAAKPLKEIFEARYRHAGEGKYGRGSGSATLSSSSAVDEAFLTRLPSTASFDPAKVPTGVDTKLGDEAFAFDRCSSRLLEMGSTEYLDSPWSPRE